MIKPILSFVFITIALGFNTVAQVSILQWEVGEPVISCTDSIKISFPLTVSISDPANVPELGTSTIRFFYDAGLLSNLQIENVIPTYSITGLSESNDVYGGVFGFAGGGGIYTQFNLISGNTATLLGLSTSPAHVLDFCFLLDSAGNAPPYNTSIVLDNNHCGWGMGAIEDIGYLVNDAGIVGTYFLNNLYDSLYLADDEVINFSWAENPGFDCLVNTLTDDAGMSTTDQPLDAPCLPTMCDSSNAEDNIWQGPSNDQWHADPTYWSLSRFPEPCDNVIITSGDTVNLLPGQVGFGFTLDVQLGAELCIPDTTAVLSIQIE